MGLGCAIAVTFAVLVNLTFTPALLFMFPNFWSRAALPWTGCCTNEKKKGIERINLLANGEDDDEELIDPWSVPQSIELSDDAIRASKWYGFAKLITRFPVIPIIVVVGLAAPLALHAYSFDLSYSKMDLVPRKAASFSTYQSLQSQFSKGA